ncbi:hypothetical protein GCM10010245_69530 [Streptomyces spectabilis]|uniref:Uncharacterized protein n=1 Tax=Streptomyces spectabilis TaxID=68270 RepID=A0A5P2X9X0_STRST|nr:hypothetical protein CP982_15720 [Streptomyces spectabilis]GGV44466.1 hypothetical protein GCM10010245_69530 [Streptomyces spectabilis]
MSEALRRITEAVAEVTEDEVVAALNAAGASGKREAPPALVTPRTPLPPPGGSPGIRSEVEWV